MSDCGIDKDYVLIMRNAVAVFRAGRLMYLYMFEWQMKELACGSVPEWVRNISVDDLFSKCQIKETDQKKNSFRKAFQAVKETLAKIPDLNVADVTYLHTLLPFVCFDKVAHPMTEEYNKRLADPDTLEHKVKKIKDKRNDVFHEEQTAASEQAFKSLKDNILDCLDKASVEFKITPSEKQSKVSAVNDLFRGIVNDTSTSNERLKRFITDWLISSGPREVGNTVKDSIPLGDDYSINVPIDPIFHIVTLSCEAVGPNKFSAERMLFKCSEIFQHLRGNITIINGEAGSGKTMLIRKMFLETLRNLGVIEGQECFKGVGNFILALFIECRSEKSSTLVEYLKFTFVQLKGLEDHVVLEVIDSMKGLVFFIDGNDEANVSCRNLIDDITKYCGNEKHQSVCFVTSRNEAGAKLQRDLSSKSIKSTALVIEKITSLHDKKSYLRKYSGYLAEGKTGQLIAAFSQLPPNVEDVLSTPILLALFCRLIFENTENISQVKNLNDVYEALFQSIEGKVIHLIEVNGWAVAGSAEVTAMNLMATFYRFSLDLWQRGSFDVKTKDISVLFDDWLCILGSKSIECNRILSCMLTPERSIRLKKQLTFQYPHLSIQEFAAAKAIVSTFLVENKERKSKPDKVFKLFRRSKDKINLLDKCIGFEIHEDHDKLR